MGHFVVTVKGEGLRATFDGTELFCGFFKNEFVRAKTAEEAEARARANVLSALRSKSTVNQDDLDSLILTIDSIKPIRWSARLFNRQGFVFHPLKEDDAGTQSEISEAD